MGKPKRFDDDAGTPEEYVTKRFGYGEVHKRKIDKQQAWRMQILRSDRLMPVRRAQEILGLSRKRTFQFLFWARCPVYMLDQGKTFRVFSWDLLQTIERLDVVNNAEHRRIIEKITGLRGRPVARRPVARPPDEPVRAADEVPGRDCKEIQ